MGPRFTTAESSVTLSLVCFSILLWESPQPVAGAKFVVGANFVSGSLWTNDPGPAGSYASLVEQYASWARSVHITVGDTLEFEYNDSHSVVLVATKEMFDSCNFQIAKDVTSSTPPTLYTVTDTQPLYFLCSVDKHCAEGQKVAILNIKSANEGLSTPPQLPPARIPSHGGRTLCSLSGRLQLYSGVLTSIFLTLLFCF